MKEIPLLEIHRANQKIHEQLTAANDRVKELERVNLELAANVEACCELTEMDMGSAIDRIFEIDNTESAQLLNKFAIEQQVKFGRDLLENKLEWCEEIGSVQVSDIDWEVQKLEEQLRKEQE
jgi:hypothetical protein